MYMCIGDICICVDIYTYIYSSRCICMTSDPSGVAWYHMQMYMCIYTRVLIRVHTRIHSCTYMCMTSLLSGIALQHMHIGWGGFD